MKLPPLDVIKTWPKANYDHPVTRGPALTVVNSVFLGLATLVMVLRLYTRVVIKKWFGWDDAFICAAYLCTVGINVCVELGQSRYGWNRHIWDVPITWAAPSLKIAFATKVLFLCAGFFTAMSLLCFYYRLAGHGVSWFRKAINIALGFIILSWLPFFITTFVSCRPFRAYWLLPEPAGTVCINEGAATMVGGVIKVVADLLITTLPIPVIAQLNMRKPQKIIVVTLLALGYLVTAAGALRVYYTWKLFYGSWDQTWYQMPSFLASAVENDLAIICACIPTIRPLASHIASGSYGYFSRLAKGLSSRSSKSSPVESFDSPSEKVQHESSRHAMPQVPHNIYYHNEAYGPNTAKKSPYEASESSKPGYFFYQSSSSLS